MATTIEGEQCAALTQSGDRCKNTAIVGSTYCRIHARSAPTATEDQIDEIPVSEEQYDDAELSRRLIEELDDLIYRVRKFIPNYMPPPFAASSEGADSNGEQTRRGAPPFMNRVMRFINEDARDPETWKGLWYMASYTIEYQSDLIKRRITGDYETDEWGLDWEFIEATRPFLDFLYKFFWRVETSGIENIPDYERAILVSNQSDQPLWDPILLMTAILNEHPAQRLLRSLHSAQIPSVPFLAPLVVKMGQAVDKKENGLRLLEQEELIGIFPERYPLLGHSQRDRFTVSRFLTTEFAQLAVDTGSPIIPAAIVSAADKAISQRAASGRRGFEQLEGLGGILPFPRRRINSLLPLPGKVFVIFGEPIMVSEIERDPTGDRIYASATADSVRETIQQLIDEQLERTGSTAD